MSIETELKLRMAPSQARRISVHPALVEAPVRTIKLFNTYFDTPDFELRNRGVALRLRRKGESEWVMTVKGGASGAGGLAQRNEWEVPTQPGFFRFEVVTDDSLRAFLLDRADSLCPVFSTDFIRKAWTVTRPGGTVEVALDRGRIDAVAVNGGASLSESLCEVELELIEGSSTDVLFNLAIELASKLHLHPEIVSKAERGFALVSGAGAPPTKASAVCLTRDVPPVDAFRSIALSCLVHLQRNEAGAVAGADTECVHQVRVAIRRLRSALKLFSPVLSANFVDVYSPRWCELANRLGSARDWDVFLSETLATLEAAFPRDPDLAELILRSQRKKAVAQRKAGAVLTEKKYSQLILAFSAALLRIEPPTIAQTKATAGVGLRKFARKALRKRFALIEKSLGGFEKSSPRRMHDLRIAFKRLRYALEFFAPIFPGKRLLRYLALLTEIQDILGQINDQTTASRLIRAMHPKRKPNPLTRGWIAGRVELLGKALVIEIRRLTEAKKPWE